MTDVYIVVESPELEPTKGSDLAAGYDLRSKISWELQPGERKLFPTGVRISMPNNLEAQIRPRSGFSTRTGVVIPNSPGTIDPDYTGEILVCLFNLSNEEVLIREGDRIAQMVFARFEDANFIHSDGDLKETERGDGGFGSTGV